MLLEILTRPIQNLFKSTTSHFANSQLAGNSETFRVHEPTVDLYWRRIAQINFGRHGKYAVQYANLCWAPTQTRRRQKTVKMSQIKGRPYAVSASAADITLL